MNPYVSFAGPPEFLLSKNKAFQRMIFNHPDINARVALDVDVEKFSQLFQERVLGLIAGG